MWRTIPRSEVWSAGGFQVWLFSPIRPFTAPCGGGGGGERKASTCVGIKHLPQVDDSLMTRFLWDRSSYCYRLFTLPFLSSCSRTARRSCGSPLSPLTNTIWPPWIARNWTGFSILSLSHTLSPYPSWRRYLKKTVFLCSYRCFFSCWACFWIGRTSI